MRRVFKVNPFVPAVGNRRWGLLRLGLLLPLFSVVPALGDTVIRRAGFWEFAESADGKTCYVRTDNGRSTGDEVVPPTVSLMIAKGKNNSKQPAEIFVNFASGSNSSNGAQIKIGSAVLTAVDLEGRKSRYWAAGASLSELVDQLKPLNDTVAVSPMGRGRSERFPTRGFGDLLKDLETACNDGAAAANPEFESQFFDSGTAQLNPAKLDAAKAQALRKVYYEGYEAFVNIKNADRDLQKILDRYKPYSDELNNNRNQIQLIKDVLIPEQERIATSAAAEQVRLRNDISGLEAAIVSHKQKLATAQSEFSRAKNTIAPHEGQFNDITSRLSGAEDQLRAQRQRLAQIDSEIPMTEARIASLEAEWRSLDSTLGQKRRDVDAAYERYRLASENRSRFDTRRETEIRVRRDFRYNDLSRELESNRRDLENASNRATNLARQYEAAVAALERCQRQSSPTAPPPNCDVERARVQSASLDLRSAEAEKANLESRRRQITDEMERIENRIRREVERYYENLLDDERLSLREYNLRNDEYQRDLRRIEEISRSALPLERNRLSSLQSERPVVLGRISRAESDVHALRNELAQFKSATGWDAKFSDLVRTREALRDAERTLASAESNLTDRRQQLETAIRTERGAISQIASLQARDQSLKTRNVELERILAQLPGERQQFDVYLEQQRKLFEDKKTQYRSGLI